MNKPFQGKIKPLEITQGQVVAFFAFEIGSSVSLEQLGALLSSSTKALTPGKKQTPSHLQYAQKPHVLKLSDTTLLPEWQGEVLATIFDFGAVSITYCWSIPAVAQSGFLLQDLPALSERLYELDLEQDAKKQLERLFEKIKPAVLHPECSDLIEDYYVFILEQLDSPLTAEELLEKYPAPLAQTLQFDTKPLSRMQQEKTLSKTISHYQTDLVIIDWNAAMIYDPDYSDTLSVFELLNVELLKARFMDAKLDGQIQNYNSQTLRGYKLLPFFTSYRQQIKELAIFKIESSLLAERVDNALKLIGDLYLARVYSMTSQQVYLPTWDASVSRKLAIINDLYEVLTDQANIAQSQLLEIIIILLILIEVILSLWKPGSGC
jgi:hypothetical protein